MGSAPRPTPPLRSTMAPCMGSSRGDHWEAAPAHPWEASGPSQAARPPLSNPCGASLLGKWEATVQASCTQDQRSSRCTCPNPNPTPQLQTRLILDTGMPIWRTAHYWRLTTNSWRILGMERMWKAARSPDVQRWCSRLLPCLSFPCRRFWGSWMRNGWEETDWAAKLLGIKWLSANDSVTTICKGQLENHLYYFDFSYLRCVFRRCGHEKSKNAAELLEMGSISESHNPTWRYLSHIDDFDCMYLFIIYNLYLWFSALLYKINQ